LKLPGVTHGDGSVLAASQPFCRLVTASLQVGWDRFATARFPAQISSHDVSRIGLKIIPGIWRGGHHAAPQNACLLGKLVAATQTPKAAAGKQRRGNRPEILAIEFFMDDQKLL
jgi:hypothetical protein